MASLHADLRRFSESADGGEGSIAKSIASYGHYVWLFEGNRSVPPPLGTRDARLQGKGVYCLVNEFLGRMPLLAPKTIISDVTKLAPDLYQESSSDRQPSRCA